MKNIRCGPSYFVTVFFDSYYTNCLLIIKQCLFTGHGVTHVTKLHILSFSLVEISSPGAEEFVETLPKTSVHYSIDDWVTH